MPLWMPRAAYVVSHFKAVEGNTELSKARSNGQSAPTRTDYGHTARARVAAVLWMEATCAEAAEERQERRAQGGAYECGCG